MDRDRTGSYENQKQTETLKALIEIYKSAFGADWQKAFTTTVKVSLADRCE